jgi:EAL domain-containing protein (putative c-di-GMP-specific phosphodiesterase class I)
LSAATPVAIRAAAAVSSSAAFFKSSGIPYTIIRSTQLSAWRLRCSSCIDLGVEIALDDFGTGFGSLSHLKKLPIDRLKVDRSFVRDMETNPDNMAIVRTIAHLGQSLGIKVTVEGVETRTQLTILRAMGCDTMQGYLFSRPVEGAQVRAFLAGERALSA